MDEKCGPIHSRFWQYGFNATYTPLGDDVESQVRSLIDAGGNPGTEQRLPLLELAFPALKRHPLDYISKVLSAVQQMVAVDGRIDIFEYLLSRVLVQHVWESQSPSSVRMRLTQVRCCWVKVAKKCPNWLIGQAHWTRTWQVLDRLAPAEKQKLLAALLAAVMKDGKAVVEELELLRVTCDLLHIPLPMLSTRKH